MNHQSERGVVSLVSAVFVSLLFVVVVVAMVNVLTREQSQAGNADESSRAYYAAQAGVEDGLKLVKDALASGDPTGALNTAENGGSCITPAAGSSAQYSCLLLSRKPNTINGSLDRDSTGDQIDLTGVAHLAYVDIQWNEVGTTDPPVTNLANLPQIFANGGQWGINPAVIEATVVRFNATAPTFDPTDPSALNIIENIIVPSNRPDAGDVANYALPTSTFQPDYGACTTAPVNGSLYNCKVRVHFLDSDSVGGSIPYKHILRLRARFNGAHFAIAAFNTSGTQVAIPDQYESIDVTANVAGTARRVRAKVAIIKNTAALDYALFSDRDICKDFLLRDSRNGNDGNGNDGANAGTCPF